jgi:hypothetical protein
MMSQLWQRLERGLRYICFEVELWQISQRLNAIIQTKYKGLSSNTTQYERESHEQPNQMSSESAAAR